jgi:hypothetical protein
MFLATEDSAVQFAPPQVIGHMGEPRSERALGFNCGPNR